MTFRDRISSRAVPTGNPPLSAISTAHPAVLAAMSGDQPRRGGGSGCSAAPRAMPACRCAAWKDAGLAVLDGGGRGRGGAPASPCSEQPGEPDPAPVRDLLSQGQLAQAVRLAEDRLDLLTRCLSSSSAQATREGRQILRVPYHRPLPSLLPTAPLRRSEIHLSRQIFNGLTRRNEENGEIEGGRSGSPLGAGRPLSLALLPAPGGALSPRA